MSSSHEESLAASVRTSLLNLPGIRTVVDLRFSRMGYIRRFRQLNEHNYRTLLAQPITEFSGSLGDLGTLLPLLIALTLTKSIALSSTLVFTGLANILTGLAFGIPLPVQPMKAVAAVAIANNFTRAETTAAGLFVAGAVGTFGVTGLLRWFTKVIPIPVVKGIQVGAGLSLVISAGTGLLSKLHWTSPSWADNYIWTIAAFLFLLITSRAPRIPYALIVFILGLFLAGLQIHRDSQGTATKFFNIWHPDLLAPTPKEFLKGTLQAGLGQLPLTTLNSVIAVVHLSADLLPHIPSPSVTEIVLSVAVMNLVSVWFGSMPVCHGSGGLAAQFRFGARSGASVIILGTIKLLLGLFVGDGLLALFSRFPKSILGIMVIAAGVELAKVGESLNVGARDLWEDADEADDESTTADHESEDEEENTGFGPLSGAYQLFAKKKAREPTEQERKDRWAVMLVTVAGMLAFKNDAIGFIAGMMWHWGIVEVPKRWGGESKADAGKSKADNNQSGATGGSLFFGPSSSSSAQGQWTFRSSTSHREQRSDGERTALLHHNHEGN